MMSFKLSLCFLVGLCTYSAYARHVTCTGFEHVQNRVYYQDKWGATGAAELHVGTSVPDLPAKCLLKGGKVSFYDHPSKNLYLFLQALPVSGFMGGGQFYLGNKWIGILQLIIFLGACASFAILNEQKLKVSKEKKTQKDIRIYRWLCRLLVFMAVLWWIFGLAQGLFMDLYDSNGMILV